MKKLILFIGMMAAIGLIFASEIADENFKWQVYTGKASWYGPRFHGEPMANTQIYNQNKISVAHRTLPLGIKVKVTNLKNGKTIIAPVLDRGPYIKKNGRYSREIDLSRKAAKLLGALKPGIILVKIEPLG
ncbi:septal ring lytic transglycosylase RlpA family protein [Patescibacteria group bacterium]|nr:septal ring lytic transglycosylase RlpA family protein [Patescibacteria group bacterium]